MPLWEGRSCHMWSSVRAEDLMPVSPSPPPAFCPALLPNAGLTNQQWPRAPHRILGFRPTEVMLPKAGFCEPLRSHGQLETGAAHLARALTGGCSYGHLITSFYFLIPKLLHMCTVDLWVWERISGKGRKGCSAINICRELLQDSVEWVSAHFLQTTVTLLEGEPSWHKCWALLDPKSFPMGSLSHW